jgi:hypothetical protein
LIDVRTIDLVQRGVLGGIRTAQVLVPRVEIDVVGTLGRQRHRECQYQSGDDDA